MDTPPSQEPTAKPVEKPAPLETPQKTALWSACGWAAHLGVVALLAALVLITFANTLHNTEFALDNKFIILEDPRLREAKWENVKLIFTQDYWWPKAVSGLYRPLTTLSYMFNYSVLHSGDKAASYHLINFLLHLLNGVLVYFFVMVLMEKLWPALLTAALFVVHPIVTESVTNIVGRADLFTMAAVMGAFLCYAKSTVSKGVRKVPWLALMVVVTTLGVFCKESAIVVLPVMVLYDFTFRIRRLTANRVLNLLANAWDFLIKGYLWLVPTLAGLWYVREKVFGKLRPPELPFVDNPLIDLSFWEARLTAIKVIGRYFLLMLWPANLSCDYSYNEIPLVRWPFAGWEDWKTAVAAAVIVVMLVGAVLCYRRHKPVFFFVMFFFMTFLPTSNLIKIIGSIMAERFMYMPSIAYAGLVVIAMYAGCRKLVGRLDISGWAQRIWLQAVARGFLCVLAFAYAVRSFVRNFDWEDDVKLWSQAVLVCPDSFKSHKSLAYALYEKDPEGKNIDRIIEEGEKAAKVTDRAQIVFLHLGAYYRIKGDLLSQRGADGSIIPSPESRVFYTKSAQTLQRAVPLDHAFNDDNRQKELKRGRKPEDIPDIGNHEIYWNLGHSYMRLGQYDPARLAYLYMRHLSPTNPDSYISLATVSIAQGKLDEAAIPLLQALLLDNNRQEALRTLIGIYRQIDREGNALVFPPAGGSQAQPRLNADSALVRNHLCTAYLGLVQIFVEAKQYELAQTTRQNALRAYNCNPAPFDQIIATIPPSRRLKS